MGIVRYAKGSVVANRDIMSPLVTISRHLSVVSIISPGAVCPGPVTHDPIELQTFGLPALRPGSKKR